MIKPSTPIPRACRGVASGLGLLALLALVSSCAAGASAPGLGQPPLSALAYRREARSMVQALSLEEKCGQILLIGVSGKGRPSKNEAVLIKSLQPGGVILFGFNIDSDLRALADLTGGLQEAAAASSSGLPLWIAVDHEGGSVFRFKSGVTILPSALVVGQKGKAYAQALGKTAGQELRALGINLALAPVVESLTPENQAFLGTRSYGKDPGLVDQVAGAYIRGLQSSWVAATAKHYPGNTGVDPHRGLPRLDVDRKTLESSYLGRFKAACAQGVGFVLLSHALVPALDPDLPVTVSPKAIGVLKKRLGFSGVVVTDDLFMQALASSLRPEDSAVAAVAAGADFLMLSEGRAAPSVRDALVAAVRSGALPEPRLDDAVARILEQKQRFGLRGPGPTKP